MQNNLKARETIAMLNSIGIKLKEDLIGKDEEIDFLLACVAAEVPILLIGDPGTGKSFLVKRFSELIGASGENYFHYLLTQFTEPSELFGPLDMNKLMGENSKNGLPSYSRVTDGKMPRSTIAFLDEIFKANSAILNTLLTLVNEKRFYNNGEWKKIPLKMLITASNEMPETEELKAFVDRIPIRIHSKYLNFNCDENPDNLRKLLKVQLENEKSEKDTKNTKNIKKLTNIKEIYEGIDSLIFEFENKIDILLNNFELRAKLQNKIEQIRERNRTGLFNCNLSDRKIIAILKVAIAKKMIITGNLDVEIIFEDIQEVLAKTWDDLESENRLHTEVYNEG